MYATVHVDAQRVARCGCCETLSFGMYIVPPDGDAAQLLLDLGWFFHEGTERMELSPRNVQAMREMQRFGDLSRFVGNSDADLEDLPHNGGLTLNGEWESYLVYCPHCGTVNDVPRYFYDYEQQRDTA